MQRVAMLALIVLALASSSCGDGGGGSDLVEVPQAPTNVSATAGAGFVLVAWEHDGANATGFVVYREAVVAGAGVPVTTSAMTEVARVGAEERSYRDDAVESGTSYRYAVAAQGAGARVSPPADQSGEPVVPDEVDPDDGVPWFGTATKGTVSGGIGATELVLRFGYTGAITELEITVTGPDGPRGGITLTEAEASRRFVYFDAPPSGTYSVRVVGDGGDETWTIDFDADASLTPPAAPEVVSATTDTVEVAWTLVPEARIYWLSILERTDDRPETIEWSGHLVDPEEGRHVFTGLALDSDAEYYISIQSVDDPAYFDPRVAPRQVNRAFSLSSTISLSPDGR